MVWADGFYSGGNSWWIENQDRFFTKPKIKLSYDPHNTSDYTPTLDLTNDKDQPIGVRRKWLKILVENKGGANGFCDGELRVISSNESRHPSQRVVLTWDSDRSSRYIPLRKKVGREFLHIAFADSDFDTNRIAGVSNINAYASGKDLVFSKVLGGKTQYAFGTGDFEIEVSVSCDGASINQKMRLHVDNNFQALQLHFHKNVSHTKQKLKAVFNPHMKWQENK